MSVNKMSSLLAVLLAANAYIGVAAAGVAAAQVDIEQGIQLSETLIVDDQGVVIGVDRNVYVDLIADYNSTAVNTGDVFAYVQVDGTVGTPEIIGTGNGTSTSSVSVDSGNIFDRRGGGVVLDGQDIDLEAEAESNVDVKVDTADFEYLQSKISTQGIGAYNDATLEIAQTNIELDAEYSQKDSGWGWRRDNESTELELELDADFSTATVLNVAYNSGFVDASVWVAGGVDTTGFEGAQVTPASVIGTNINTTAIGAYNLSDVTVK